MPSPFVRQSASIRAAIEDLRKEIERRTTKVTAVFPSSRYPSGANQVSRFGRTTTIANHPPSSQISRTGAFGR